MTTKELIIKNLVYWAITMVIAVVLFGIILPNVSIGIGRIPVIGTRVVEIVAFGHIGTFLF